MTPDELVEKVARVLVSPKADPSDWRFWTDEARAAIAVLRPALRAEVLEEAAKVADGYAHTRTYTRDLFEDGNLTTHTGHSLVDPRKIAAAIRALIKEPT